MSLFDEPIMIDGKDVSYKRPKEKELTQEEIDFHERIRIRSRWESDY